MMDNNVSIVDKNGSQILAEGISHIRVNSTGKQYILYTLNETVENNLFKMYVGEETSTVGSLDKMNDEEWNYLRNQLLNISHGQNVEDIQCLPMAGMTFNIGIPKKLAISMQHKQIFQERQVAQMVQVNQATNADISVMPQENLISNANVVSDISTVQSGGVDAFNQSIQSDVVSPQGEIIQSDGVVPSNESNLQSPVSSVSQSVMSDGIAVSQDAQMNVPTAPLPTENIVETQVVNVDEIGKESLLTNGLEVSGGQDMIDDKEIIRQLDIIVEGAQKILEQSKNLKIQIEKKYGDSFENKGEILSASSPEMVLPDVTPISNETITSVDSKVVPAEDSSLGSVGSDFINTDATSLSNVQGTDATFGSNSSNSVLTGVGNFEDTQNSLAMNNVGVVNNASVVEDVSPYINPSLTTGVIPDASVVGSSNSYTANGTAAVSNNLGVPIVNDVPPVIMPDAYANMPTEMGNQMVGMSPSTLGVNDNSNSGLGMAA